MSETPQLDARHLAAYPPHMHGLVQEAYARAAVYQVQLAEALRQWARRGDGQ